MGSSGPRSLDEHVILEDTRWEPYSLQVVEKEYHIFELYLCMSFWHSIPTIVELIPCTALSNACNLAELWHGHTLFLSSHPICRSPNPKDLKTPPHNTFSRHSCQSLGLQDPVLGQRPTVLPRHIGPRSSICTHPSLPTHDQQLLHRALPPALRGGLCMHTITFACAALQYQPYSPTWAPPFPPLPAISTTSWIRAYKTL